MDIRAAILNAITFDSLSITSISERIKVSRTTVRKYVHLMHQAKEIHIREYRSAGKGFVPDVACFIAGPGEDAPKPDNESKDAKEAAEQARAARGVRRDPLIAAFFGDK